MEKAILIIGVLLVLWGVWVVFRPQTVRKMIHLLAKGLLVYVPAVVRVALGVVFLLAARDCRVKWLIMALGIIMFAAGIIMFMMKPARLRSLFEWWANRSVIVLRVMGIMAAAVGGLIAWAA